ncbi:hypothetical protein LTS08_004312 [Lithohypha guttulata]|nr:hypothetical protein LTS08_004312 [Lithohypha guttulata]
MNWTGGRLNRHARSKTNPQLKAQRRHFAKASLERLKRGQREDTDCLDDSHISLTRDGNPQPQWNQRKTTVATGEVASKFFPRTRRAEPQEQHQASSPSGSKDVAHRTTQKQDCASMSQVRPADRYDQSLSILKERFLNTPDWLGLSAAQPVEIQFAPAHEMANIGRHRKQNTISKTPFQLTHNDYSTSPLLGKRKRRSSSEALSEPKKAICARRLSSSRVDESSPSSPSRLAINFDSSITSGSSTSLSLPSLPLYDAGRRSYRLRHDQHYQTNNQLLSLEEVKHFSSFDDIQAKYISSGAAHQQEDSQKDQQPSQHDRVTTNVADTEAALRAELAQEDLALPQIPDRSEVSLLRTTRRDESNDGSLGKTNNNDSVPVPVVSCSGEYGQEGRISNTAKKPIWFSSILSGADVSVRDFATEDTIRSATTELEGTSTRSSGSRPETHKYIKPWPVQFPYVLNTSPPLNLMLGNHSTTPKKRRYKLDESVVPDLNAYCAQANQPSSLFTGGSGSPARVNPVIETPKQNRYSLSPYADLVDDVIKGKYDLGHVMGSTPRPQARGSLVEYPMGQQTKSAMASPGSEILFSTTRVPLEASNRMSINSGTRSHGRKYALPNVDLPHTESELGSPYYRLIRTPLRNLRYSESISP